MNLVLGFDTETSDFKKLHIVQLAAGLYDVDTKKLIQSIDLIVKPDGWEISEDATNIHGITTEYALKVGISERYVVAAFLSMAEGRKCVAYNAPFDKRVIRKAIDRYYLSASYAKDWVDTDIECAMKLARQAMNVKSCKLTEAYSFFMGKEMKNAHTAMADTQACMDVYFAALEY